MSAERRCPGIPPRVKDRDVGREWKGRFACFNQPLPGKQEDIQRTRTPQGWTYIFTRNLGTIHIQTGEPVTRRTAVRMKNDSIKDVRLNMDLPAQIRNMFDS